MDKKELFKVSQTRNLYGSTKSCPLKLSKEIINRCPALLGFKKVWAFT